VVVKFAARDSSSSIERAQYSVDGGDWILVSPVGNVSDAAEEHYQFTVAFAWSAPATSNREHTIAVRAYDRFENVGSAKTTFIVPAGKP
jgi:flavin-binding protein dodecin